MYSFTDLVRAFFLGGFGVFLAFWLPGFIDAARQDWNAHTARRNNR